MAEEKKRRGRRDHLNDFYRDVSGNYVYTGVCYEHTGGVRANTALLRRLRLMAAVMAAGTWTTPKMAAAASSAQAAKAMPLGMRKTRAGLRDI